MGINSATSTFGYAPPEKFKCTVIIAIVFKGLFRHFRGVSASRSGIDNSYAHFIADTGKGRGTVSSTSSSPLKGILSAVRKFISKRFAPPKSADNDT